MSADQGPDDTLSSIISRTVPGLLVAAVSSIIPIGIAIVGFLWQQTVSLAKMNETLAMVCKQLEEGKAVDREQDRTDQELSRRLSELEKVVIKIKH